MTNIHAQVINVEKLFKTYHVADKSPGIKGTIKHFLRRRIREVHAINDVSFSISPGEIVGFLGANGAGKTTLLKMLCGLIYPTSGSLVVGGYKPQRRQSNFLKQITLVMGQKQQLLWDLPPMDSLKVNAAVYGIPDSEANRRIKDLSEMLELGNELSRPVRKLSLGQRMKAELLAALLHRPSVLFLDEPTLGLDVNAQSRVRSFLSDYNKKTGATILLTSHYMADITALCQRVICIHHGSLFYDGHLDLLANSLRPCKEVRFELGEHCSSERLEKYGHIKNSKDGFISLLVPREKLTVSVSSLLSELNVIDLEVRDPPIEELIGELFTKGNIR